MAPAALDELGEAGVVAFAAGEHYLAAEPGLWLRLARAQLLRRLAQVGQYQILGTHQRHELYHVELIAGDVGVGVPPVAADLRYQAADLVVLPDGAQQRLVGGVDPELFAQFVQDMRLELPSVVQVAVFRLFERHVREFAEEIRVLDNVHHLQVLLEAAGDGAGLRRHLRVEEVVAALERALEQAAAIVAGAAGHVVCGYVRRGAARRAQPDAEAALEVEQYLRHKIAGVSQGPFPLGLRLLHEGVVGLLEQVLKEDQVLQVSHMQTPTDARRFALRDGTGIPFL